MTVSVFYVKFINTQCYMTNNNIPSILSLVDLWLCKELMMFCLENIKINDFLNLCAQF